MNHNVPHIYDHFHFEDGFQPEHIITQFLGNDLTFGYWKDEKFFYITLAEVFHIAHAGKLVNKVDLKHSI